MRKIFLSFLIVFCAFALDISAQDGIRQNLAAGEVTAVSETKISLQTKDGAIDAMLSSATEYKRVPPENPTLKAAVASSLAEVGVGDKVMITGLVSDDKKTMPAKAVYILSKSDLAQKKAKEQEWRTRGMSGRITAINPQTKEITVKTGGLMGANVVITPKADVKFLRFPQDSVNFNDAKEGIFEELAVGDSLNAVGDKSADGATFQAEKILTGASQQISGTITAINAEKGEITLNNIQTKKDVVIIVNKNTIFLKKFPPEMAQRMAQFQAMQAQGGGNMMRPPTQGNQQQNPNQNQQQNPNQTQGGGMNRGGGGDFLETLPNITLTDLKVGDMIGIAGSKAANLEKVTVFRLLAGVEPFLKMPQIPTGGGNRQGGGVNSNFSIPGLDGAGIP
jgi:hypothetical protein